MLTAGFASADITPPVGTPKIGWIKRIVSDRVLDGLSVHCAVLRDDRRAIAFVALDTLCVPASQAAGIRHLAAERLGLEPEAVMVSATHNHAGPAVTGVYDVPRDEGCAEAVVETAGNALARAVEVAEPAAVGFARAGEFSLTHNRRVVRRDGTVRTHGKFDDGALFIEGPIDPEMAVLGFRSADGRRPLGSVVNFACHPTHHGGGTELSAGFPGVLARRLSGKGWPVCLYLQGAAGDISPGDPYRGVRLSKEAIGGALADRAAELLEGMAFADRAPLRFAARTVRLPFRDATEAEIRGRVRGAQRFVDPGSYDRHIPAVLERIRREGAHEAEVQLLGVGDAAVVGLPGEIFTRLGLAVKQQGHPRDVMVASCTNGSCGYVPTAEAFARGGYETTFGPGSFLAPEAGGMLVEAAIGLLDGQGGSESA